MPSKQRTPRFSISETPVVAEFLEMIWSRYPRLRGNKAETVTFALSVCAHGASNSSQQPLQPVEKAPNLPKEESESNPLDNLDDLDM